MLKGLKIVTLFLYTVWRSAMKFGMVIGLANGHVSRIAEFGKLWGRSCNTMRRLASVIYWCTCFYFCFFLICVTFYVLTFYLYISTFLQLCFFLLPSQPVM